MAWHRIKCRRSNDMELPNCCPNCLGSPAQTVVTIRRSYLIGAVRGLGSLTYEMEWTFCEECAARFEKYDRMRFWFGTAPGIATILGAIAIVFTRGVEDSGALDLAGALLGIAVVILLVGNLVASLFQWRAKVSAECISSFPAVRVNRSGKNAFSSAQFVDVSFRSSSYLAKFVQANRHLQIERK